MDIFNFIKKAGQSYNYLRMMKQRTVEKTLFFAYFIPIVITVFILSLFFFIYTSQVLRNREESNLTYLTDKMVSIIDSEIAKMNNLSLNISNSTILKNQINLYLELTADGYSQSSTEIYLAGRDISNTLAMTAGPVKTVPQINYITPDGRLIGAGTYNLIHEIPLETELAIEGIDRTYGKRHFSNAIRDPLAEKAFPLYKNQNYISLYRSIFSENSNKTIGIIEVKQFAETIFYGPSKANKNFMIFNAAHEQLYPFTLTELKPYTNLLNSNTDEGIFSFRNQVTDQKEIISVGKCREINWTILNIARENDILLPVHRVMLIMVIGSAMLFIFSISVARRFSGMITTSLGRLNGWISNLHWDNLADERPETSNEIFVLTEFEEIHQEFLKMNKKLYDSMKLVVKERSLQENARMLALQSQMDPHFMYNMLTSIGIMAEEGESENIIYTITHLTSILRYTASRSRLYVPLREEIEISRNYLECMKIRFGEELNYKISISPEIFEMSVPKLIILPLVENSIKYSTIKEPPWEITIDSQVSFVSGIKKWRLTIKDNGPGFSSEALNKNSEMIASCDKNIAVQLGFHFDGLGLPNIYSRMMLYYNNDFSFSCYNSTETGGACIEMEGPVED